MRNTRFGLVVAVIVAMAAGVATAADKPLRVFVLVGQSNMQGKGKIAHLEKLATDPATAKEYAGLMTDGKWVERDDVFIKYWDKSGPLTVGYGSPTDRIGPELGFGMTVGDKLDEPVLLIKVAWGGQSLGRDFRPPSSGLPPEEKLKSILENTNKNNAKKNQPAVTLDDIKATYGARYRDMIDEVHRVLANLKEVAPGYKGQGFELAGLVYFQGFNDVISDEFRAEYGVNMVNFVRDVRKDLGAAKLPIVIGELGMDGVEPNPRYAAKHFAIREAQEAPSKMPEFAGTVGYARTAPYVVKDGEHFDGGYHYNGRADTFYKIGQSFGDAMMKLINPTPTDNSKTVLDAGKKWEKAKAG